MEFILPSSPAGIIIVSLLGLFVAIQITVDSVDIKATKRIYKQLIQVGKKHSKKTFTVVVTLNKRAESISQLLDHVYGLGYENLQVIVIVKHTAGRNARAKLTSMRRKHQWQNLYVIGHKKGQSDQILVRRYSKGDLIIELLPSSRLNSTFFDDLSYELLLNPHSTFAPIEQHRLDTSLTNALASHFELWASLISRIIKRKVRVRTHTPLIAHNHHSALTDGFVSAKTAHKATITSFPPLPNSRILATSYIHAIVRSLSPLKVTVEVTLFAVVTLILSRLLDRGDLMMLVYLVVALYITTYALNMLRQKELSAIDKLNLFLLSPFALIYGLGILAYSVIAYSLGLYGSPTSKQQTKGTLRRTT